MSWKFSTRNRLIMDTFMIVILFLMLVVADNPEFFEMVDTQTKEGYTWEYVGKTLVKEEISLPVLDGENREVYYWYLTKPKGE